jgi:hypothetical protein
VGRRSDIVNQLAEIAAASGLIRVGELFSRPSQRCAFHRPFTLQNFVDSLSIPVTHHSFFKLHGNIRSHTVIHVGGHDRIDRHNPFV